MSSVTEVAGRCVNSPGRGPNLVRGTNMADAIPRLCVDCGAAVVRISPKALRCEPCRTERKRVLNREAVRRCYTAHAEERRVQSAAWKRANPDYHASWYQDRRADPDFVERQRQTSERTRLRLKDEDPTYFARWNQAHPEAGQRSVRARRARKLAIASEPYTTSEIGDRDDWRCLLCGKPVSKAIRFPDGGAPSVDHIVPLSRGGTDLRSNVQLAHLRCNLSKHNRTLPQGEQLRLIG